MMCFNCVYSFIADPVKLGIIGLSFVLAIFLLVLFAKKKSSMTNVTKLVLVYSSVFFLVFPFIFFLYGRTCQTTFLSCGLYKEILYSLPVALGISLLIGFAALPFIYRFSLISRRIDPKHPIAVQVTQLAQSTSTKMPLLFLVDKAEPIAFSFSYLSPRIFLSVGLCEMLLEKEREAVILHELGHIKQKSSYMKLTDHFLKLFTPLSSFYKFHEELREEEIRADAIAIEVQQTKQYLESAKAKVREFYT